MRIVLATFLLLSSIFCALSALIGLIKPYNPLSRRSLSLAMLCFAFLLLMLGGAALPPVTPEDGARSSNQVLTTGLEAILPSVSSIIAKDSSSSAIETALEAHKQFLRQKYVDRLNATAQYTGTNVDASQEDGLLSINAEEATTPLERHVVMYELGLKNQKELCSSEFTSVKVHGGGMFSEPIKLPLQCVEKTTMRIVQLSSARSSLASDLALNFAKASSVGQAAATATVTERTLALTLPADSKISQIDLMNLFASQESTATQNRKGLCALGFNRVNLQNSRSKATKIDLACNKT